MVLDSSNMLAIVSVVVLFTAEIGRIIMIGSGDAQVTLQQTSPYYSEYHALDSVRQDPERQSSEQKVPIPTIAYYLRRYVQITLMSMSGLLDRFHNSNRIRDNIGHRGSREANDTVSKQLENHNI